MGTRRDPTPMLATLPKFKVFFWSLPLVDKSLREGFKKKIMEFSNKVLKEKKLSTRQQTNSVWYG